MEPRTSLRISILLALGLGGCSASSQPNNTSGGSSAVVAIPSVTATSTETNPTEQDIPEIPLVSSKIGWITEPNGNTHRASATSCDPSIDLAACQGNERLLLCNTDADCTEHPHGKCVRDFGQMGPSCACRYSCASDADCDDGQACVCKGTGKLKSRHSLCAPAACTTDADCKSHRCDLSAFHNGCSEKVMLACRLDTDKCSSDKDCKPPTRRCIAKKDSKTKEIQWSCVGGYCSIGRPLVVEGAVRTAPPTPRDDWHSPFDVDIDGLDQETRSFVANRYADMAAMEHASIASFARFSLQLLALGAPAHLVEAAHRAALDEIEHARIGYALATVFGKSNVGPDNLPEAVAPMTTSIEAFVEALVIEGCVGETLGAAEAREAAERALFSLRPDLERIANDEETHATLAWKTLQWALDVFGAPAQIAAERAFERATTSILREPAHDSMIAETWGILSGTTAIGLRRSVVATVIEPCARALGIQYTRKNGAFV